MVTFRDIMNDEHLLAAVDALGFSEPTEIQAATIPLAMEGKDVIGQAKTGSGKTFAFGIPIMHRMTNHHNVQALVLTPTRELCQQVAQELRKLATHNKARIVEVYGGVSINPQIDQLRSAQIVVGTPGRVLDHLERETIHLDHVSTLVLDEADRMLDMGFIEDIEQILRTIPPDRQTLLFSATMPEPIKKIAHKYMIEPEHVRTQVHVEEANLPQFYVVMEHNRKFSMLVHFIEQEKPEKGLIFCGTRRTADLVAKNLQRYDIQAESIHGGLSQAKRNSILEHFHKGKLHLLIATDVAARGLHIPDVSHVFNYDVPNNPEDYIHRIGRTARAGKTGKAITLLEHRDFPLFQSVLDIVPQEPEKLDVGEIRSVGFRKHDDGESRGFGAGARRAGPGGPRRGLGGPRREGGGFGGGRGFGGRGGGGTINDSRSQREARRKRRQGG